MDKNSVRLGNRKNPAAVGDLVKYGACETCIVEHSRVQPLPVRMVDSKTYYQNCRSDSKR